MESDHKTGGSGEALSFRKPYERPMPPCADDATVHRRRRTRRFTMGDWTVRPALGVIERGDTRTTLEPRLLDVLACLAGHDGDVVTVDELLDTCWPGAFHGDNPVHKAIAMLRKALGDDARAPRYVQTIRKRGYRILVPVSFGDDAEPATPPPLPAETMPPGDVEVVAALAEHWYAGGRRAEDLLPHGRLLAHAAAIADGDDSAMSRAHARFIRHSRRQAIVRSCILVCMSSTILSLAACVLLAVLDGHRGVAHGGHEGRHARMVVECMAHARLAGLHGPGRSDPPLVGGHRWQAGRPATTVAQVTAAWTAIPSPLCMPCIAFACP